MMENQIFSTTQNNVERNALFPTSLDAEDHAEKNVTESLIIPSVNKTAETGHTWGHAGALIDTMVDGYNEALTLYRTKFVQDRSDDIDHRIHLEAYLRTGKALIVDQVFLALQSNSLPEVGVIAGKYSDEVLLAIAEVHTDQRFAAALERLDDTKPTEKIAVVALENTVEVRHDHVTYVEEDPNPETSHKFREIIKEVFVEPVVAGIDKAKELGKIGLRATGFAISEPVQIIKAK